MSIANHTNLLEFYLPRYRRPKVSIIINIHDGTELAYQCIRSIALAYNETTYEVIAVARKPADEADLLKGKIENLVVFRNSECLKFPMLQNEAISISKGEYLVFLNDNIEVSSFWLDELLSPYEMNPEVGLTGSKLLNSDRRIRMAGGNILESGTLEYIGNNNHGLHPSYNFIRQVDFVSCEAMCIPELIWNNINGFSREFLRPDYLSADLALKVTDAGYKVIFSPSSVVVSLTGEGLGQEQFEAKQEEQNIDKNKFVGKWLNNTGNDKFSDSPTNKMGMEWKNARKILVIDYKTPMPDKDAGSYAAIQEIKLLQALGFEITFVPEDLACQGEYTTELQRIGVEVLTAPFYASVRGILDERISEISAVYITRYNVAEKYIEIIRQNSKAKIILNVADLHFLREMREANNKQGIGWDAALLTRSRELAVMKKVDAILSYSETECAIIFSHIGGSENIFKCPWVLEPKTTDRAFEEREGIAFLGGFKHKPNIEAVNYFVKEVMPSLHESQPELNLYVYGSNMPDSIKNLENDHVKMVGFVESLDTVFHRHRIFVAPLLSGAGVKGKVLEAMAYSVPIVLTGVAAEGLGLTNNVSAFFSESPEEWVCNIVRLYKDEKLWTQLSEGVENIVNNNYSFNDGKSKFKNILDSLGLYSV